MGKYKWEIYRGGEYKECQEPFASEKHPNLHAICHSNDQLNLNCTVL